MADNIYERVKSKGYEFKTVGIKLVRSNFSIETREITFPSYQMNKESISSVMGTLLNRFKFKDDDSTEENTEGNIQGTNNYIINSSYVRKLGIKLSNLSKIERDKKNSQKSIMDFI
jgi:DNA polymerase IV (archaeal DinB-like DNA polymerase)